MIPVPQRAGKPLSGLLLPLGALVVVLVVGALSRVPPPTPADFFTRLVVIHDTLLPTRVTAAQPLPERPPEVQSTITSILDDVHVDSWVLRHDRDRVSVHRVRGEAPPLPSNAQRLTGAQQGYDAFEVSDLTLLAWTDPAGRLHLVVGTAPMTRLVAIATWFRTEGPGG